METLNPQVPTLSGIRLSTLFAGALILVVGTTLVSRQVFLRMRRSAELKEGQKRQLQATRHDQAAVMAMQNECGPAPSLATVKVN